MSEPIEDPAFWKGRLTKAVSQNKIWWSVYLATRPQWENIELMHRTIIKKLIAPGQRVLDVGCAYGRFAKYFPAEQYIGIDISPDLLDLSRLSHPKHSFALIDAEATPFHPQEFDWAICGSIKGMIIGNTGYGKWRNIEVELRRVAKHVLLLEYVAPEQYELLETL